MLMLLHTLLIHDGLTVGELRLTTPSVDIAGSLSTLMAADWVYRQADQYRCRAVAYPQIRSRLATAGYSVPVI